MIEIESRSHSNERRRGIEVQANFAILLSELQAILDGKNRDDGSGDKGGGPRAVR